MIASHYAEPVERTVVKSAGLHEGPSAESAVIRKLEPGEPFAVLDDSRGWAWGYAGRERRVGYFRSEMLEG